jgi:hypothetical protein
MNMGDMAAQLDMEHEHYDTNWRVACRLYYAFLDGYLTTSEFDHVLGEMNILDDWKRSKK